jgi:SPP1 gp7 family putative phage head morphogenesis protein
MSQSVLQHTINDYRNRLDKAESAAMTALQDAHQATLATIQPTLDRLYQQIQDKLDAGDDIPLSWLYEQNRLQTIEALVTGQIDQYGALSRTVTGRLQNTGVQLGQGSAQDMMQSLIPASVQWSFGVPNTSALVDLIGATQPGSPLYTLFNSFGTDAATDASQALITGIATGMNPNAIAPMVRDALNVPLYRAKTIARTEMLRSYRSAQVQNYRANSDVVDQWRWTCALGANTCEACLYYDGQLFPLDQDMDFQHINCRCSAIPVTKSWANILGPLGIDTSNIEDVSFSRQSGMDWFNDQAESVQQQILGPRYDGWANGDFTFKDMVGMRSSTEWGDSMYVKSLKELVA